MRKNFKLTLVALSLLALTACSAEHEPTVGKYPILFGCTDTTRATANLDSLKSKGFRVYAYVQGNAGSTTFVKDVEYTDQNVWSYEGLEYWLPNTKYYFKAFYPTKPESCKLDVYNNDKDQNFTINSLDITLQEDIMVAAATEEVAAGHLAPPNDSVVDLNFQHLLACVTIAVKSEIKDITINSITLSDINDNGNYDGEWSSSNSVSITIDSATSLVTGDDKYTDVSNGGFLVIPAEISGVTLTINASNKTYENIEIPAITWQKGMKYTYRVDIKQNDIVFNDPNVAKWDSDSATGSVIIK